jgi:putative PIG3 family NAD(P)H quinone oxidoreductase
MPGVNDILVRVRASALNRADLLQRRGNYPPPPGYSPDIPGLEYAGEVVEAGRNVSRWKPGDRVMGITGGGGHAELLRAGQHEAIRIPANLNWQEAAAIPEAFITAFDALVNRARLAPGEWVLIHAVGSGVGTAAVQLAAAFSAVTIGTSRTPAKLEKARTLGLVHGIDGSGDGWADGVLALAPNGVDVVLDLIGGDAAAENLKVAAPGARVVLAGLVRGSRAELDLGLLLRRRIQLIGTVLRTRGSLEKATLASQFTDTVLPLLESGVLAPVIDRVYHFEQVVEAHEAMERNESFGKIVLIW